jgi:mRNA interferase YafQ
MYLVEYSKKFRKSVEKLKRSGKFKLDELDNIIEILSKGRLLPIEYQDHALHGKYMGCRECHVRGDILLVYRIEKNILVLVLVNIGTHAQLFGK